jgi:hypothetical protein
VLEHVAHGALVVEEHLPGDRDAGQGVADADGRQALRDLAPALGEGPDGRDDDGVHAAIRELERQSDLDPGVAVRVRDQELAAARAQVALHARDELLQVEVGEAADHHPDARGRAAAQRARDRIRAEPQLVGRRLHPRLGLGRAAQAAQGVRDGRRREPRVLGELADRRPARSPGRVLAIPHVADVT